MHRSLEMFIERWRVDFTRQPKELYKIMRGSVKQALFECSKDIEKAEWASYENFALKVLQCFADWAYEERIFVNAKEVYTEMTFSYYKEKMQLEEEIFPAWMNGTADLIIQNKDGDFVVLDYKSDYAPYLDGDKFEQSLSEMYKNQLLEYRYAVSRLFDVKEEVVKDLIEKYFTPPQLTYDRFMNVVDSSHKMFYNQHDSALNIINLAAEDTPRIESELEAKLSNMKAIIDQIEELTNELVINLSSDDKTNEDVKNLLEEMENLISSVKEY